MSAAFGTTALKVQEAILPQYGAFLAPMSVQTINPIPSQALLVDLTLTSLELARSGVISSLKLTLLFLHRIINGLWDIFTHGFAIEFQGCAGGPIIRLDGRHLSSDK